jgi:hypothetical protein
MIITPEQYEMMRARLYGGHNQNPFAQVLKNRTGIPGPVQGTDGEFSQILYELTRGELDKRNEQVAYEVIANGKKNLLKFSDGSLFSVVRTKSRVGQTLIVIAPYAPSKDDLFSSREMPLAHLVFDNLRIQEVYKQVSGEYKREERRLEAEQAAEERRISRESSIEATLRTIEKAKSGETIMIRGLHNIDALVKFGFVPSLVNNPDNWVDAEDVPGLRYRHTKSGTEVLLTAREKFRPIGEPSRLELYFLANRSDDDPASFKKMQLKYRTAKEDGSLYSLNEFHDDLIAMAKYPEELKCRTEEDLGLMADEVEQAIDRRHATDKGILPLEAVFNRNTQGIIDHILKNKTPDGEIRRALDYFEYTGMIDPHYKATLDQQIKATLAERTDVDRNGDGPLYDKRVKEIVTAVLKTLSPEKLTSKAITLAISPYVSELGFAKLVKIRERILQLRELVHNQEGDRAC